MATSRASSLVVASAGALGGRLDHTLGNLNTLYKNPDLPLVLIGEGNIVRLLPTGNSIITMNPEAEGIQCGVIPLGSPSMVTSRGLKYDMGMHLAICNPSHPTFKLHFVAHTSLLSGPTSDTPFNQLWLDLMFSVQTVPMVPASFTALPDSKLVNL